MKKVALVLTALSMLVAGNVSADTTAQAVATWTATAKKDTSSKLVVTPIGSLSFDYVEGIKGFNTQKGLFDVTIQGETTATGFKLSSRLVDTTLTQLGSTSTLNVGVAYNGQKLTQTADTQMIDTATGMLGGNLSPLSQNYKSADRVSAMDAFMFSIASATQDGSTAVTDMSTLPDGVWSGEVKVQFDATWTA
ncbi:common pilus major fimbrillin subunit EcpA [Rahnella bruchi]|uniref:common pilus major fimbrillin subunit EcpA n=1 Tax=Rahnella bruchi TaxID=1510573 RepID=UPI000EA1CB40|nr:common pilus major fimbrillin subunit EcpA [Rahnella bruchi]